MSVPATETAAACIQRCCDTIASMHCGPTLQGARTADLLGEITAAAHELEAGIKLLGDLLLEAENIDDQMGTG